jgi:hypothetical protein
MEQTIDATTFGRVLGDLMESRGISPEPEGVRALAERSGLEPHRLIARMADERSRPRIRSGALLPVAEELELSEPEKTRLALAFCYEFQAV